MPLAVIMAARGVSVSGSDRAVDQGRGDGKFAWLEGQGIALFPQDGSGVTSADQVVVASAAIENSVPDIVNATALGCARMSRAELLSNLFNAAKTGVAIGGTSGKSTVTGMVGWILQDCGLAPTIMNGAVMKNFVSDDAPFASAVVGSPDLFVSEVDESDGSIALYRPAVAVLNNVTLDHKSMEELRILFGDFMSVSGAVVVNLDDPEVEALLGSRSHPNIIDFGIANEDARLGAQAIEERPDGVDFLCLDRATGTSAAVALAMPGRHNVANALAAIGAAMAVGVTLSDAGAALSRFSGMKRRMDVIGSANGITVIDDFGHNPDKIAATLDTLHAFPGRLLMMFQPHGYGPIRLMGEELAACFAEKMTAEDRLWLPDPAYFGGTTDMSKGSDWLAAEIAREGGHVTHVPDRAAIASLIAEEARPGDRIVIMGARDDSLPVFAAEILRILRN